MDLIGPELFELSALELEMSSIRDKSNQNIRSYLPLNLKKLLNLTLFTL